MTELQSLQYLPELQEKKSPEEFHGRGCSFSIGPAADGFLSMKLSKLMTLLISLGTGWMTFSLQTQGF